MARIHCHDDKDTSLATSTPQIFNPVHKRSEATVESWNGKAFKVTKGVSLEILSMSANTGTLTPLIAKQANEFHEQRYRQGDHFAESWDRAELDV